MMNYAHICRVLCKRVHYVMWLSQSVTQLGSSYENFHFKRYFAIFMCNPKWVACEKPHPLNPHFFIKLYKMYNLLNYEAGDE